MSQLTINSNEWKVTKVLYQHYFKKVTKWLITSMKSIRSEIGDELIRRSIFAAIISKQLTI